VNEALADLTTDFASGHLRQADILWRAALNGAAELSQRHTPKLGTRSLDVLHVACARELRLRYFLTFDERQQQLAAAAGEPEKAELAYWILEHLAANGRARMLVADSPCAANFAALRTLA